MKMKKLLSVLLAFAMVFSVFGIQAFAEDETAVAKVDGEGYPTLDAAFAAATDGQTVEITVAGTYNLPSIKSDITIKAADGIVVVFDNIGAYNTNSSNVTFENIAFDYYPNVNYTGLQHSGNLIYNNCTIDGQVFLYGTSETFNNCVFNQNSSDAYNVWTYGAKEVEFNKCTFNSAGKAVLIYKEGNDATFTTSVNVVDTDFIASAAVDGKAAIEMDSSLIAGIDLIIDADTTATGFDTGSVSNNSLWNNKKGNSTEANNDITVVVDGETVLEPIYLATTYEVATKEELITALGNAEDTDIILLTNDIDYGTDHLEIKNAITLDLGGKTLTTKARNYGLALRNDGIVVTNGKLNHAGTVAAIKVWNAKEISNLEIDVTGTSASGNTIDGIVIQENAVGVDVIKNVKIYSTSGQGVAVGIKTHKCGNASENVIESMEKVDIDAKNAGMFISAPCGTATNCNIKGGTTGVKVALEGTYTATLDLVDCDVEGGTQALYVHDEGKGYDYNGFIKLTADDASTFKSESGEKLVYAVAKDEDAELSENIMALLPVATPTGSNSPAYTKEVDGYVRVWGEGGGNASESFVLKLYSEDTLMATTKLNNIGGIIDGDVYVTWNFFYPESNDEYWTTTWEEGHPNVEAQPTHVDLIIDGSVVCTTDAKMSGADDLNPVVWEELGGVKKDSELSLPTATVTELENDNLTFALNFKADEVSDEQLAYYGNWYADFVLTVNKDITFNANGGQDGYLSGQYDAWSENWVNVPFEDVTLKAGESIKIMEYAATLMGQGGLKLTYNDVYSFVKDFDCGVFLEPDFIAANEDLEITLELRMFNPEDESISYVIGETYEFTAPTEEKPDGFLYTMYAIDMPKKIVDGTECYQFGMFAGIDSLNYREVGFKYSLDEIENATGKLSTTTVYTEIIADNGTFTPKDFGDAEYIFAHYLWLPVRQDFDYSKTPITFNAYAIDMDGNEIDGRSFTAEEIVTK